MKYTTRICLSIFFALFVISNIYGQAYMRYKMKDGSFNGFYTNCIDSISHIKENGVFVQKVYSGAITKTIPVDNIIDISFESATLDSGQDAGEYKIVEFDGKEGFKKAYVDNRATLIASKTGDFFANDTILMASAYNNTKCLFFTDENGRVSRFFDGDNYLIIDNDDDVFVVNDFSNTTRGVDKVVWKSFEKAWNNPAIQAYLKLNDISLGYLVENLDVIANDPELHSQRCIYAVLSLAGALIDPIAYLSSILALLNYDDSNPFKVFDDFYGGIAGSIHDLLNEMWPDSETMKKYRDFYANKYNLYLTISDATNITTTSATFNGSIFTEDGLRGDLYFCVWELLGNDMITIPATQEYDKVNQWKCECSMTDLKPDTWYCYYLKYICTVDKLKLEFTSETANFETLKPYAYTGKAHDITSDSAIVDCEFKNAEGLYCCIYYSADLAGGGNVQGVASASNGKQTISLSGLTPSTTYSYYAVVKYGDKEYRGQTRSFTTSPPDISGTWTCNEYSNTTGEISNTYNITLNKDGTAKSTKTGDDVNGHWTLSSSGVVDISITRAIDHYYYIHYTGHEWYGKVDNIYNPTKITGTFSTWNYNGNGYFDGPSRKMEMTR